MSTNPLTCRPQALQTCFSLDNLTVKNFSTLQLALGVSALLHAVVLTTRFVDPQSFDRIFKDTPLEVILVNAKSNAKPEFANAIAQASLLGGGQFEKGRATSPLPPSALTDLGDSAEDAQKKVDVLQEQQTLLLAHLKKQLASMPPPDLKAASNDIQRAEREEKRKQLVNLLAEIEKRINEENARPKKRYTSPATREGVEAIYLSKFIDKVETLGTQNFPSLAGKKLYGELIMVIHLNAKGEILETEIAQSSGHQSLDRIAQAIVKAGAPYGNFTPAMLKEFQIIVTPRRFEFKRNETLETQTVLAPR